MENAYLYCTCEHDSGGKNDETFNRLAYQISLISFPFRMSNLWLNYKPTVKTGKKAKVSYILQLPLLKSPVHLSNTWIFLSYPPYPLGLFSSNSTLCSQFYIHCSSECPSTLFISLRT